MEHWENIEKTKHPKNIKKHRKHQKTSKTSKNHRKHRKTIDKPSTNHRQTIEKLVLRQVCEYGIIYLFVSSILFNLKSGLKVHFFVRTELCV